MISSLLLVALLAYSYGDSTPQPSVEPTLATTAVTPTKPTIDDAKDNSDLTGEGQDQVAILKQINRVNEDGSYTFGYEAADGSFKIETRDVVGNVKGMFGFVDEGGELRRVSYSASNGTGFQSTGSPNVPPLLVTPTNEESSIQSNHRVLSSTEKSLLPIYIYGSSTPRPTPEVIQHIPKLRPTPASISTAPTESEEITTQRRPSYGTVLPKKSSTPNYITLRTTTPSAEEEGSTRRPSAVQLIRPKLYKKIVVTKRPVDPSTTAVSPVTTTFYPVPESSVEDTPNSYQREVDFNSITEAGLTASGTEDSPDVYGGSPTGRPFPGGVYQNVFPQVPQYQRILQSAAYLQNQNPYLANSPDPRLQPTGAINPYPNSGVSQLPVGANPYNRYRDQPGTLLGPAPLPNPRFPPSGQDPQSPIPIQYNRYNYGQNLAPESVPFPQNLQQGFRLGTQQAQFVGQRGPPPYPQLPPPQRPIGISPYPQPSPQGVTPIPPRYGGQTLPTPTSNPSQGLLPVDNTERNRYDEATQRLSPPTSPPQPENPNQSYVNPGQYGPEQTNSQLYFMEQLLRMLIAAQARQQNQPPPPPPPPQQLSPFQQALLSILGPNNIPSGLIGSNYDPRFYDQSQALQYQQRPQYDPRYSLPPNNPYFGYQDPYAQYRPPYSQGFNYYQNNPYAGYSNNPYYQGTPEQAFLRMILGAGFAPAPQPPIPQIQQSPAAFDRSQQQIPQTAPDVPLPPPSPPIFGRRIPVGGNIVQRSPVFSRGATTPTSRLSGSRSVQILNEDGVSRSEATPTTSKPR